MCRYSHYILTIISSIFNFLILPPSGSHDFREKAYFCKIFPLLDGPVILNTCGGVLIRIRRIGTAALARFFVVFLQDYNILRGPLVSKLAIVFSFAYNI